MSSRIVEATRVIARMEILHVARVLSSSYIYIYISMFDFNSLIELKESFAFESYNLYQ